MEKEIMSLPLIVGGEEVSSDRMMKLEYDDLIINFPVMDDEIKKKIIDMDQDAIHDLSLSDIVAFLQKVSYLWLDEEYSLRKMLMEYGPRISGQSPEMYKHNLAVVLQLISFKSFMEDVVDLELGDKRLLDEWLSKENAEIHAEPLGRLLHIISGNVALVGFYSVIRGILTKNVNIVKLSQKDLLATYLFIKSFADVDPEHPVTKSVSAVYWNKDDSENIEYFSSKADGMIVWGGHDTIKAYKSICPVGCEFIEYGPKKGIQIIDIANVQDRNLELKVAHDISVFDQEACLSPQLIFVKKGANMKRFNIMLLKGLDSYNRLWPAAKHSVDHYIHMNYHLKCQEFLGNLAWTPDNREWMIVHLENPADIKLEHPLGRTIFIKEVDSFDECLDYIDGTVQTVGIAPKSLARELRGKLTRRGVTRIANIGSVEMPREGLTHEGIDMRKLVRIVGMDKENEYHATTYDVPDGYFDQFIYSLHWAEKGE